MSDDGIQSRAWELAKLYPQVVTEVLAEDVAAYGHAEAERAKLAERERAVNAAREQAIAAHKKYAEAASYNNRQMMQIHLAEAHEAENIARILRNPSAPEDVS